MSDGSIVIRILSLELGVLDDEHVEGHDLQRREIKISLPSKLSILNIW